jgi:2-polyprenyl-3-methyl-5-hydroxy-6-metoxy-1,4-benzoquinol methylase
MEIKADDPGLFIPIRTWDTQLPLDILEGLAARMEFAWLCDHVARLESPDYVAGPLRRELFSYFDWGAFAGKRMLDFGCGIGASSIIMAEWLPELQIVGAELDSDKVDLARRIAGHKRLSNVSFYVSPDPGSLPAEVGQVDFIMLSAVYEHLLPNERKSLMPLLWKQLKPGGTIFINQTPFRWFPYEHHTTGLLGINYLPDWLACHVARNYSKFSKQANSALDWQGLLRRGIRGGTEPEMLRNLQRNSQQRGTILQPTQNGLRDRADLWLSATSSRH